VSRPDPATAQRRELAAAGVAAALALAIAMAGLAAPWPLFGQSAFADLLRAEVFHAAVGRGELPPRWTPELYGGYGSPIFFFYAPLPYALIEVARQAGLGAVAAAKAGWLALWLVGVAGAWRLARRALSPLAAIVAAALHGTAPYLLVDVYVRGGIGEFAGLALLPWALGLTLGAARDGGRRATAGSALAWAGLVVAHNITALVAFPCGLLLALAGGRSAAGRRAALAGLGLGLAIAAGFWIPALAEKGAVHAAESLTTGRFDYRTHFLSPVDLLPGRTAVTFSRTPTEKQPFRFGELFLLGLLASPWLGRAAGTGGAAVAAPERDARRARLLLAAVSAVALAMTTAISAPLWRILPLAAYVQFPFRFFLLATVAAAPLGGGLVDLVAARFRGGAAVATIALGLGLAWPLLDARYLAIDPASGEVAARTRGEMTAGGGAAPAGLATVLDERWIAARPISTTSADDYLPRAVERLPDPALPAAEARAAGIAVRASERRGRTLRATVEVTGAGALALHQFAYAGWRVEVDGRERAARPEPGSGRLLVELAPGEREVVARFGSTPLRRGAAGVSLLSLLAAGALAAGRAGGPWPSSQRRSR
jgi:hypothetical protein